VGEIRRAGDASTREGDAGVWVTGVTGVTGVTEIDELVGSSPEGFDAAALQGLERANRMQRDLAGIEILKVHDGPKVVEAKARVEDGSIAEFLVTAQMIFVLEENDS
jgi:flavin-binding protein dodecin